MIYWFSWNFYSMLVTLDVVLAIVLIVCPEKTEVYICEKCYLLVLRWNLVFLLNMLKKCRWCLRIFRFKLHINPSRFILIVLVQYRKTDLEQIKQTDSAMEVTLFVCCTGFPCLVTVLWLHCSYISIFIVVDVPAATVSRCWFPRCTVEGGAWLTLNTQ